MVSLRGMVGHAAMRRPCFAVDAISRRDDTIQKGQTTMRTKPQRAFSESDKAAWRAAKQQRLTDLGEQLKTQVAAVQDSDAFKRYLAAQADSHRYSARNVFLILYQRPEATRVAGYTGWQRLGRQVRRGETGITIFPPSPFKHTSTDTTTGEVTEEIIPRFKTATVFDISMTDGEPLPTINQVGCDRRQRAHRCLCRAGRICDFDRLYNRSSPRRRRRRRALQLRGTAH